MNNELSNCCQAYTEDDSPTSIGEYKKCTKCGKLCNFKRIYETPHDVYLDILAAWGDTPLDQPEVIKILEEYTIQTISSTIRASRKNGRISI